MVVKAKDSPLVAGAEPAAAGAGNTVAVRVLSQFRLPGREDPTPGDVVQLHPALVAELLMYGRVEIAAKGN